MGGTYHLEPGFTLGDLAPQNTIDRGLFFDGNTGHVRISGIILNTNFSVHYWVYFCTFTGDLLRVESETPTQDDPETVEVEPEEEQEIVYGCGQSQAPEATEEEAEVSVEYNNEETTSTTSGNLELKKWVDLNLISRYHEADGTTDITFHIGEFQLEFTVAGNPFHHKKDTDII